MKIISVVFGKKLSVVLVTSYHEHFASSAATYFAFRNFDVFCTVLTERMNMYSNDSDFQNTILNLKHSK